MQNRREETALAALEDDANNAKLHRQEQHQLNLMKKGSPEPIALTRARLLHILQWKIDHEWLPSL